MRSLKDVIGALRRELDEALDHSSQAPSRTRLEAERIILTMELAVREEPGRSGEAGVSFGVLTIDVSTTGAAAKKREHTSTHTLTIEFKPGVTGAVPPPDARPFEARIRDSAAGQVVDREPPGKPSRPVELLKMVFGDPGGFASFCRAETFLIAVGDLSDAEYAALPDVLTATGANRPAGALALACGQIKNILRSGPAKSLEKGAALLRDASLLLPRDAMRELIVSTWRNEEPSSPDALPGIHVEEQHRPLDEPSQA